MARERVAIKPGWVNTELPESFYYDKDYLKIFAFFVLHAFRPNRSSKGRTMADYGWPKDVWRNKANVGLRDVFIIYSFSSSKNANG